MNISRKNTLILATFFIAALGTSACEKKETSATPEAQEPAPSKAAPTNPGVEQPTQTPADPGKLVTIMAGIADEMTLVQLGLWTENFDLISESAMKIADHSKVSAAEKARVVKALGEDMPAFGAMDKVVHDSAMRLSEAASANDLPATLKELTVLQSGCVSCHSTFRARLVE
jgi:cytochrome c556